jgi:hypothetical protein
MLSCLYRAAVLFAAGCAMALFGHAVLAQGATDHAAYMAGIRLDRSMLAGPLATSPRSALRGVGSSSSVQEPREYSLIGSSVLLEMQRVGPDGKFVRPRLLIGRQSPELNNWMKSMGVTPERCMLPMFRGRLHRVPETGKITGAVLMSARCTFY